MNKEQLKRGLKPIVQFCRKYAIAIFGSLYLIAILCVNSIPLETLIQIAPSLYLLGLVFNLITHTGSKKKLLVLLGTIYVSGMLYEIVSLKQGKYTGIHAFGDVLGPTIYGVPMAMGFNWFLLLLGAGYFSRWIFDSVLMRIVATSFFMVLAYFIMDPVCQSLGFWQWDNFHLNWGNYGSRIVLTLLMSVFFAFYLQKEENRFAAYYYMLTTLLFITVNIVL